MTEPTQESAEDRCAALKAEIDALQAEFEKTWMAISGGGGDPARYRELRGELQEKRIEFNRVCGTGVVQDSSLPRSITADWRG
jgi:hypothetical protein